MINFRSTCFQADGWCSLITTKMLSLPDHDNWLLFFIFWNCYEIVFIKSKRPECIWIHILVFIFWTQWTKLFKSFCPENFSISVFERNVPSHPWGIPRESRDPFPGGRTNTGGFLDSRGTNFRAFPRLPGRVFFNSLGSVRGRGSANFQRGDFS